MKWLDGLVGSLCVSFFSIIQKHRTKKSHDFKNILILRPGGIGDATLLTPTIIALKKARPEARIDVLAERRNAAVFSLCSSVNVVYRYDNPQDLHIAIRNNYDVVIDTEQWHRLSAVVARLTNAALLIGFATNERKSLFTHPIPYSLDEYEVNSFMDLTRPLSLDLLPVMQPPFLTLPPSISESIRPHLQSLPQKGLIAVFPGGSIPEKRWEVGRFHTLAEKLIDQGFGIAVVGGKEDIHAGGMIARGLQHAVNLCGGLSLPETAAVLKESTLLISGDSGILHLAFGLGIKTIALYGPGNDKKWAPRGEGHITVSKSPDCSPCSKFGYTPRCKKDMECMKKITVEEVFEKAMELLER